MRYINSCDIKDEFLFYSALEITTKADDVLEKFQLFSMLKILIEKMCLWVVIQRIMERHEYVVHEILIIFTAVRWLLKGNVINRVFEIKDKIKLFLEIQERKYLVVHFEDEAWNKMVAYLFIYIPHF